MSDSTTPVITAHQDLNTFRHLATNLLVNQQIRLPLFALRLRKDFRLRPPVIDANIVAKDETISSLGSHHRDVVATV